PGPWERGWPPVTERPGDAEQPEAARVVVWVDDEQEPPTRARLVSAAPQMRRRRIVLAILLLLPQRQPGSPRWLRLRFVIASSVGCSAHTASVARGRLGLTARSLARPEGMRFPRYGAADPPVMGSTSWSRFASASDGTALGR